MASDENQTDEPQNNPEAELASLKKRADIMGLQYSSRIGVDALRKKIDDKLEGKPDSDDTTAAGDEDKIPAVETVQQKRKRIQKKAMALVRCQIYNQNPSKRDLQGEIVTVASGMLGTVRKFIPFGEATENGYHIPQVLFDELKERRYQDIRTVKKNGQIDVKTRIVPEYTLNVLPPLTAVELKELAEVQGAAERVGV
jgi:hypothetical protein